MIKDNVLRVKTRIALACLRVNRDPAAITIAAVSKGRTAGQIQQALAAGITVIGENKVQEALAKYGELANSLTCEL